MENEKERERDILYVYMQRTSTNRNMLTYIHMQLWTYHDFELPGSITVPWCPGSYCHGAAVSSRFLLVVENWGASTLQVPISMATLPRNSNIVPFFCWEQPRQICFCLMWKISLHLFRDVFDQPWYIPKQIPPDLLALRSVPTGSVKIGAWNLSRGENPSAQRGSLP